MEGDGSAFFILTSWITIHIPEISVAYCAYRYKHPIGNTNAPWRLISRWSNPQNATQQIKEYLLKLVQSLLDLALNLFAPGNRMLFKFGGQRGSLIPTELLLKRCLDIVWVCLINIQAGEHELQGFDSRSLMDCKMKLKQVRVSLFFQ